MTSSSGGSFWCSDRCIAIITVTFLCVVTTATVGTIFFSLPAHDTQDSERHQTWTTYLEKAPWTGPSPPGPLPGVYHLTQFDDNYERYLLAMDISEQAVPHILAASETLVIEAEPGGQEGNITITMKTITNWVTRSIKFNFNKDFMISYGKGANSGVLHNYCVHPVEHVIQCKSEEKRKMWKFEFDLIFSREGLVNNRIFITKNIGMKKIYKRDTNL